MYRRKKKKGIT